MMFGMPREASHASKLAMMLGHLTFEREASDDALLSDVCAALLDHSARRARLGEPVRMISGTPLLEPQLRDAAFVLGALWDAPRIQRFARSDRLEGYACRTAEWLRPVVETHGMAWRWPDAQQRQAARDAERRVA
jgi:hypothetical protein